MKRLVRKAQFHGVWNSPLYDGIPSDVLEDQYIEKLKRLIKDDKYDPVKEADSDGDAQVFNFPPYTINAVRFMFNPSNGINDSNTDFFNASRDMKNDQWDLALFDKSGNQIAAKSVTLPKGTDTSSILELEAKRFIQEQPL